MAAFQFADDLVRDYLRYRGFPGTLKAFDAELKTDKDKAFRPDRIVDHLSCCINSMDLNGLRDSWSHLDNHIFRRLEQSFLPTVRKLEMALLRMYVVVCVSSGRHDKLTEFFEKMAPELHGHSEWKDWFALPFLKGVEDNPTFQVYFTRQWQDMMLISLRNFLSVVFQSMALPTLLSYEEELNRMQALQEENESLRTQLTAERPEGNNGKQDINSDILTAPDEPMDDFYVIAQEAPAPESRKTLQSFIRNFSGIPTSPILGRRSQSEAKRHSSSSEDHSQGRAKGKMQAASSSAEGQTTRLSSQQVHINIQENVTSSKEDVAFIGSKGTDRTDKHTVNVTPSKGSQGTIEQDSLLLLSQEEYTEHHSCITHCKFSISGTIASADMDGVLKVWTPSPSVRTQATVVSKSCVLALEWVSKPDWLLVYATKLGNLRLYDSKERRAMSEITPDASPLLRDYSIACLACNPVEPIIVGSTQLRSEVTSTVPTRGKLLSWDLRSKQLQHQIKCESAVNCCVFSHNGQLLVCGTATGEVRLFDVRTHECIANWAAHDGEVLGIQFSGDETSCFTVGLDHKLRQWSVYKTGKKISEFSLHPGSIGSISQRPVGKLFALSSDNKHVLTCGTSSGIVYKIGSQGTLEQAFCIGNHKATVVTVDWSLAVDCGMCVTGAKDGTISVATLLTQS